MPSVTEFMRLEHWRYTLPLRLRSLFSRRSLEQELNEEFRFHIERQIAENIAHGYTPEEARYAALRAIDGLELHKEECRDMRRVKVIENLTQDLRYGFRNLCKTPVFAMAVVLTLALGIGANTAVFSLVDALLLQVLPVPHPEQLFAFIPSTPQEKGESLSYPDFRILTLNRNGLGNVFGYANRSARVRSGSRGEDVTVQLASPQYFKALEVSAARGRTLDDLRSERANTQVAVISDGYWQHRFKRSPAAIGSTLILNDRAFSVVGIMPPGFRGVSLDYAADFWLPLASQPELDGNSLLDAPGIHWVRAMTRLEPGVSVRQASVQATALIQRQSSMPVDYRVRRVELASAARPDSGLRDTLRSPLLLLLAIVGLLLLVACVNVAHLLEARSAARSRELSVRIAIGAGRGRLIRQLLTETVLLAAVGSTLAVFVSWIATRALTGYIAAKAVLAIPVSVIFRFHANGDVLGFTTMLTIVVDILFGLSPALRASDVDLAAALKSTAPTSAVSGPRQRRRWLLSTQMSISLLLLIIAGLLIRSFKKLNEVDLGFSPTGVVQLQVDWGSRKVTNDQILRFADRLLDQFRTMPGVSSASMAIPGVFSHSTMQTAFQLEGQPTYQFVVVHVTAAAPGFFHTLGIPLLRGRDFTLRDRANTQHVVILSETMARTYFAGVNPIGQHVRVQGEPDRVEVIGVAKDIKLHSVLESAPRLVYVPLTQNRGSWPWPRFMTWEIRSASSATSLLNAVVRQVHGLDPTLRVDAQPVVDTIAQSILVQRLAAWLTGLFGVLGLMLAAVGAYGLLSYVVLRRTPEIGIRLALGAGRSKVLWLVWSEAMRPVALGMALGLLLSIAATRLLGSYLFGLTQIDPLTLAACLSVMTIVAGLACYLPARRAARVDPLMALRYE